MNVSTWAAQNPNYNIGENLTLIQHLKHQLHLFELPLRAYEKWWEVMGSSQRYAESTVLAALAVYLDYDICIWRRQSTATRTMNFACLFSSLSNSRQIHSLLDGKADSVLAADGHFSLIMDYTFSTGGSRWGCGKVPHDFRLGTHSRTNAIDLSEADADVVPDADALGVPITDQPLPLAPLTVQNRQLRCRLTKVGQCNVDHVPVVKSKARLEDPLRLSSYGLGHTDGGRRDVVLKSKGSRAQTLKDVGGWAFQLLCSRGEKYVGSASLGPGSTNNIGEFTAVLKIVEQAIVAQLDQLDVYTDSNLAVQYYENTCLRDCPHLATLFETIEMVAAAGEVQFRLIYVKAHAGDIHNEQVDSMCTAVIKVNDTVPRFEGPTKIPTFSPHNSFAAPRRALNTNARYQTLPPFAPFIENDTSPRGVEDLSDDRGNIIHICPLCEIDRPIPFTNRRSLLTHLRSQHLGESRVIADDVLNLFGIQLCGNCDLHYSVDSIKNHHCRPGAVRNVATAATQQKQAVPIPAIFALLMTRPSQIPEELVDRLTAISYDDIFSFRDFVDCGGELAVIFCLQTGLVGRFHTTGRCE
jgi:ribonuclease HI